jgi:hypothetical protein
MTQTENLLKRPPNDIGGLPAESIKRVDHELEPWEKRCHALADVLDFHKIVNTEEKRRGVEELTYYEAGCFANILFQKGVIALTDLARKMDEVEARWSKALADEAQAHDAGAAR